MPSDRDIDAGAAIRRAAERERDGDFAGAAELYRRALRGRPAEPEIWYRLGLALRRAGRTAEAAECLEKATLLAPDRADYEVERGIALHELGRRDEASAAYRAALRRDGDNVSALTNLGVALLEENAPETALEPLARAAELAPTDAAAQINFGAALHRLGRIAEAIAAFETAIAAEPGNAEAWSNLGVALQDELRIEDALAAHRRAVALAPAEARLHWNLAVCLLLAGDYPAGFAEYEWRRALPDRAPRRFPGAEWRGEDPAGRTILVHAEQGIGDAIQFARYVPQLAARGARIIVAAHTALAPVLATLEGAAEIVAGNASPPPYDLQVPLLSLPHLFATTFADLPAEVPYLAAPPGTPAPLPPRSATTRIGLVWAGNPNHPNDRNRSLPFAALTPLFDLENVEWISLQVGSRAGEATATGRPLLDLAPQLASFAETAAAIAALDLVLSVDTAVAHLAGAMARPVWLMLPYAPDWRWLVGRDDSPWYPTMRLFRQDVPGDWSRVVGAVRTALLAEGFARC